MNNQIIIYARAVGKERPRHRSRQIYTPRKTVRFERLIRFEARVQLRGARIKRGQRCRVRMDIYFITNRHPDIDNIIKAVLDGLQDTKYQQGVYANDTQVVGVYAKLHLKAKTNKIVIKLEEVKR